MKLSDVGEEMCSLIKPAIKGGANITLLNCMVVMGSVKSIHLINGIYRIYLEKKNGSGEYRYSQEKAATMSLSIW